MLSSALELHDTTVGRLAMEDGRVILHLESAYIHKSEGIPGVDAGSGWSQPLDIVFEEGSLIGSIPELPEDISSGRLQIGEEILRNMIPLPFSYKGKTLMTINFVWGEVVIKGSGVSISEVSEASYVENFPRHE